MGRHPRSLRRTLGILTVVIAALVAIIVTALIVLTAQMQRTTTVIGAAVESIRLTEEAEVDLLLHDRTEDPIVRSQLEHALRSKLARAREHATSSTERAVVDEAVRSASVYLDAMRDPEASPARRSDQHRAAFAALDDLVEVNLAQSRREQAVAARLDSLANMLAVSVGVLLVVVTVSSLLWMRRAVFTPIAELSTAMQRFGRGDHGLRATEMGPTELRSMIRRFNEMAGELARRRETQLAFLGGVAHDLRSPLGVLQMSIALVDPDRPLPPEPALRRLLARVDRQIVRLDRMLGDFLDTAKIEAGELDLRLELRDARELVTGVVELFRDLSSRHALVATVPDERVFLRCDPIRIEQVIGNLVSNAIKYSPEGGRIGIEVTRRGDEVAIAVSDTGIGISDEDQRRLFEPFTRLGLSKDAMPGVGLGLSVVRRIVTAHGGRIEVASALGQGSTFRVILPGPPALPTGT